MCIRDRSRMVPKTWHQHEFYAEFTPEVSTPGLQVWGIVDLSLIHISEPTRPY